LLFDNAATKGADCRDSMRVLELLLDGQRARGARLQGADGEAVDVEAKVVVDATGQQSLVANALGLKRVDPALKKAAIWTYFNGAEREPGKHGGATIILHTQSKEAWFWYIPLADDVTSVGVVGDNDFLLKRGQSPEEVFAAELANCPAIQRRLAVAEQVDKHHVAKEFSYRTEQAAGEGWVLVGDAWGFIDPIYSSGVYFAMKSGELAADAIVEGLAAGDTSAAMLGRWTSEFASGTRWVRRLVDAYYTNEFSFGHFMKQNPGQVGALTDLLIGRIFHSSAGDIFQAMDPMLEAIKQSGMGKAESRR
jgi:flavin-dependent dehydrogenase